MTQAFFSLSFQKFQLFSLLLRIYGRFRPFYWQDLKNLTSNTLIIYTLILCVFFVFTIYPLFIINFSWNKIQFLSTVCPFQLHFISCLLINYYISVILRKQLNLIYAFEIFRIGILNSALESIFQIQIRIGEFNLYVLKIKNLCAVGRIFES